MGLNFFEKNSKLLDIAVFLSYIRMYYDRHLWLMASGEWLILCSPNRRNMQDLKNEKLKINAKSKKTFLSDS